MSMDLSKTPSLKDEYVAFSAKMKSRLRSKTGAFATHTKQLMDFVQKVERGIGVFQIASNYRKIETKMRPILLDDMWKFRLIIGAGITKELSQSSRDERMSILDFLDQFNAACGDERSANAIESLHTQSEIYCAFIAVMKEYLDEVDDTIQYKIFQRRGFDICWLEVYLLNYDLWDSLMQTSIYSSV